MTTENEFAALDSMPTGVLILDKNGVILYWNALLELWTGRSRESLSEISLFDIYPELYQSLFSSTVQAVIESDQYQYLPVGSDNCVLPVRISRQYPDKLMPQAFHITPMEYSGGICAVVTIDNETEQSEIIDILQVQREALNVAREQVKVQVEKLNCARAASLNMMEDARDRELELAEVNTELIETAEKLAEQQERLQQAQKMEAVGTLAGGIAHDFNNLLGVILGCNELAQRAAPASSGLEEHLSHIHTAGTRARDLVKQILDFSSHGDRELIAVSVDKVVEEALSGLSGLSGMMDSNISVKVHRDCDTGAVMADQTDIHRLFSNLCINAVQAMEQGGGRLDIDLDVVEVGSAFANERLVLAACKYVRVTIRDTGCGIDAENIQRIFEPFFTTRDVGQGTGMGLASVHSTLKHMDGAISVYSVKDEGTTFHIYIPQAEERPVEEAPAIANATELGQRIMVVDDEELLVTMCKAMLGQLGHDVISFSVSPDALTHFAANPDDFDLIVTDQRMPDLTGAELTAEIHTIRPDIPVILVTGYSEEVSRESAASFGFSDFLPKPYTKKHLSDSIAQVLASRQLDNDQS